MAATTITAATDLQQQAEYRPIKLLGKGSFGQVWLACTSSSKLVCLKAISFPETGDALSSTSSLAAANQEVDTLKKLNHVNCVRYLGSFSVGATLYICLQYADGGDLALRIDAARQAQQPFSERQVLLWLGQMSLGLEHLHGRLRILHRDLKPQNVLLRRGPHGDRILIGDVGISKALSHTLEQAHTAIGTPQYLAPEIFQSNPYGFAADVWSLGCLLFELVNLMPAFSGRSLNDLSLRVCTGRAAPMRTGVSTAMREAIMDILVVNPARRPAVLTLLQSPLIAPHVQVWRFISK